MERTPSLTRPGSRRPARLTPLRLAHSSLLAADTSVRTSTTAQHAVTGYPTRFYHTARAHGQHATYTQQLPTRQSKPLGRLSRTPTATEQRAEAAVAAPHKAAPLSEDQATALLASFTDFQSPAEETYAAQHALPALFSSLVQELSHVKAEHVGSGHIWVRDWFERQPAVSTATTVSRWEVPAAQSGHSWQATHQRHEAAAQTTLATVRGTPSHPPLSATLPSSPPHLTQQATTPVPRAKSPSDALVGGGEGGTLATGATAVADTPLSRGEKAAPNHLSRRGPKSATAEPVLPSSPSVCTR